MGLFFREKGKSTKKYAWLADHSVDIHCCMGFVCIRCKAFMGIANNMMDDYVQKSNDVDKRSNDHECPSTWLMVVFGCGIVHTYMSCVNIIPHDG